jgi:phosphoribosylanthranilate isomerase
MEPGKTTITPELPITRKPTTLFRTRVKICGVTRVEDALAAAQAGADAVGMILWARSPRLIETAAAARIAEALPPFVNRVGVFVDASAAFVARCARALKLDYVQLHGVETLDYVRSLASFDVIRAIQSDRLSEWTTDPPSNLKAMLIDSPGGGSGVQQDWPSLSQLLDRFNLTMPVIVAGGLDPGTVRRVIETVRPFGVDVSSGVETSPGIKSPRMMTDFVRAVHDSSEPRAHPSPHP